MKLFTYTNGVGHLIMSIFLTLVGLALIIVPGISSGAQGVGIGLILTVQGAWFVSGAAKQVATEVVKQSGVASATVQQVLAPVLAPALAQQAPDTSVPVELDQNNIITAKRPVVKPGDISG